MKNIGFDLCHMYQFYNVQLSSFILFIHTCEKSDVFKINLLHCILSLSFRTYLKFFYSVSNSVKIQPFQKHVFYETSKHCNLKLSMNALMKSIIGPSSKIVSWG